MVRPSDKLVDAVCKSFVAARLTGAPKPLPDNAYFNFRQSYASSRAALVGLLLSHDQTPEIHEVSRLLTQLSGDLPLAMVKGPRVWREARNVIEGLHSQRQAAREYWRTEYPVKTPAHANARLLRRLELNDLDGFVSEQDQVDGLSPFQTRFLEYKRLERLQHRTEADQVGQIIFDEFPEEAAKSGVGYFQIFRTMGRPETGLGLAQSTNDPFVLERALQILKTNERFEDGIAILENHHATVESNLRLALTAASLVLASDGYDPAHRVRLVEAAAMLPPVQQPAFFARYGFGSETDLANLLRTHLELGMSAFWSLPLIEAAFAMVRFGGLPLDVEAALPDLMQINLRQVLDYDKPLMTALRLNDRCEGVDKSDAATVVAKAQIGVADVTIARTRAALDKQSAGYLSGLRHAGRPLMLYSTHTARIGLANFAPSIVAADAGYDVVSVTGHAWVAASDQHNVAMSQLRANGIDVLVLNTQTEDAASQSAKFSRHLRGGGALTITNDGLLSAGTRVMVPWLLRPYVLKSYAAQLALAKDAEVAISAEWINENGGLDVRIVPVTQPPQQGTLGTRATWLTQRCARKIRMISAMQNVPYTYTELDRFGGVPLHRELTGLAAWSATKAVQDSVFGWVTSNDVPAAGAALIVRNETLTFAELQTYVLRIAEMVLHFQSDKPQHARVGGRPIDQHRVALLLPKSAMAMAMSVGSVLAGSLVTLIQDDLEPVAVQTRLEDFEPDLIVACATPWSVICAHAPHLNNSPVLICDDNAGADALEDILEGFEPAAALPDFAAGRPAVVVYTSGSEGVPKAAVLATDIHSAGAGLDKLTKLSADSRVAYVGRWDTVLLLDLMACLRGHATVCAPSSEDTILSPDIYLNWCDDVGLTFLSAPASVWRRLSVSRRWTSSVPPTLCGAMLWGERIPAGVVADLEASAPDLVLYCTFGATEFSYISFGRVTSQLMNAISGSPGGEIISGGTVHKAGEGDGLDADEHAASSISVSGVDAMIGYWSDVRTYDFLPAADHPRSVLINDNVILRDDGQVDLLGRSDSIIKISARRVSVISIEKAAETVGGVARAIVFQLHTDDGDRVAMAVEVSGGEQAGLDALIRGAIKIHVGAFAVPSRILVFSTFPQMNSGKVDRRELRAMLDGVATIAPAVPIIGEADSLADMPTLAALREWARDRGYWSGAVFAPDAAVPDFTSIDVMELMLLFEERFDCAIAFERRQLKGLDSWQSLADLVDDTFGQGAV